MYLTDMKIRYELAEKVKGNPMNGTYAKVTLTKQSAMRLYQYFRKHLLNCEKPRDFHITTCYSKNPIKLPPRQVGFSLKPFNFGYELFGPKDAEQKTLVLTVDHPILHKLWKESIDKGGTWDYDSYRPHITLAKEYPGKIEHLPLLPKFSLLTDKYHVEPLRDD